MANERIRIHIWQSPKNGEFYFKFVGRNGKKLNIEGYKRRHSCVNTVKLLQEYLPTAPIIYDKKEKPKKGGTKSSPWPFLRVEKP
jgi:uncharacterized protein YegP (UPF0339 family)